MEKTEVHVVCVCDQCDRQTDGQTDSEPYLLQVMCGGQTHTWPVGLLKHKCEQPPLFTPQVLLPADITPE